MGSDYKLRQYRKVERGSVDTDCELETSSCGK